MSEKIKRIYWKVCFSFLEKKQMKGEGNEKKNKNKYIKN